eukprot:403332977
MLETDNNSQFLSFGSQQLNLNQNASNQKQNHQEQEDDDTPNTRMQRKFYAKYNINPLETVQTMRYLKKTDLKIEIRNQVQKEMREFENFMRQFSISKLKAPSIELIEMPDEFHDMTSDDLNQNDKFVTEFDDNQNQMNELKLMNRKNSFLNTAAEKKKPQNWQIVSISPTQPIVKSQNNNRVKIVVPEIKLNLPKEGQTNQSNRKPLSKAPSSQKLSIANLLSNQEEPIMGQGFKLSRIQQKILERIQKQQNQEIEEHKSSEQLKLEAELNRNYFFKTRLYDKQRNTIIKKSLQAQQPEEILEKLSLHRNLIQNCSNFKTSAKTNHVRSQTAQDFSKQEFLNKRQVQTARSHFRPTYGMKGSVTQRDFIRNIQKNKNTLTVPQSETISQFDPTNNSKRLNIQQIFDENLAVTSIISHKPKAIQETEIQAVSIIRDCLKMKKISELDNQKIHSNKELIQKCFDDLDFLFQHLNEDEDLYPSSCKEIGQIFNDYVKQKQDFVVGKGKKDVLQEFIDQELKEYLEFREHGATIYDAILQKYSQQQNQRKKKNKKYISIIF